MLNQNTAQAAHAFIENCIDQGLLLSPAPNSPLGLLVEESVHPDIALAADYIARDEKDNPEIWLTAFAPHKEFSGAEDMHAQTLDDASTVIANSVSKTIDIARNHVNPVVLKVIKDIQHAFENSHLGLAANIGMRFSDENSLLNSTDFISMVNGAAASSILNRIPGVGGFKELAKSEIITLLKSDVDTIDVEIAKWISAVGDTRIKEIFEYAFVWSGTDIKNDLIDVDFAIGTFLFANHIYKNEETLVHVNNLSLSELRARLSVLINQSAAFVKGRLNAISNNVKRGQMIESYPRPDNNGAYTENNQVIINRSLFEDFISKGGNIEMIYGNTLSDERGYTVDAILSNGKKTERLWESHMLNLRNQADSNKLNIFKRTIISSTGQWIKDHDDFSISHDNIIITVRSLVSNIDYSHLGDIYNTVLNILDKTLFNNTDAVKYLRIMNRYAEEQPNLELRQIATLAATEYVAAWVSSMILVEK